MRCLLVLTSLALSACVAPLLPSRSPLADDVLRLVVQPTAADELELHVGPADRSEVWAVASGVNLVLGEDRHVFLPFTRAQREEGKLIVRCRNYPDHRVVVTVHRAGSGMLRVEVEDRVQLRSQVRELTLAYDVRGLGPPSRTHVPHLHPEPHNVAGDRAFRAPLLYFQGGSRALCLTPDLVMLGAERRLPQGLELDLAPARLRHGLIAHGSTQEVSFGGRRGSTWFSRRSGHAVEAQGESLRFAHRLRLISNANEDTLAQMLRHLWEEVAEPELQGTAHPLHGRSMDESIAAFFEEAVASRWVDLGNGGFLSAGILADGDHEDAWFSAFHQSLRTAYGLQLFLERTGETRFAGKVASTLDLALMAPRRGGLSPSVLTVSKSDGTMRWEPDSARAGFTTHYHLLDTASTGYWMLLLSRELPEQRDRVLKTCGETAAFFIGNQGPNGAIPSFYDSTYVAPKRDALFTNSAETGAAALFLAEYGDAAGDAAALEASARALDFLARDVVPKGLWLDSESYLSRGSSGDRDPRSGVSRQGSIGMIYTALAALRLFEIKQDQALATLARRTLGILSQFQQVWSPPYLRSAVVGGFGAVNCDARWNDARSALAAAAFLEGHRLLGDRQFLERGVAALRAAFTTATHEFQEADGSPGPTTSPHSGMGAAATIAEIYRRRLGHGVVDVGSRYAQAMDSFWFSDVSVEGSTVHLGVLTEANFVSPLRICFRGLRDDVDLEVLVNGQPLGTFAPKDLERGIAVLPARVPRLTFAPPPEIRSKSPWWPRAGIQGTPGTDWHAYIEVVTPGSTAKVPLALSQDGDLLVAKEPYRPVQLDPGARLEARLVYEVGGHSLFEPRRSFHSIQVTDFDAIDPGEGDEAELVDAGLSRRARFPDGLEDARVIRSKQTLRYEVPVRPEATHLEIRARISGKLRIHAGDRLIHEDEGAVGNRTRELRFQLADRRLWQTGKVAVVFQAADPDSEAPCYIALIRYRGTGEAAITAGLGKTEVIREPQQALHVLVLPVALPDRPLNAGREALSQLFFGGPEYRLTPEPEARTTTGSVSSLVTLFSGGRTSLKGVVLAPARWPHMVADFRRPKDPKRQGQRGWQDSVRAALVSAVQGQTKQNGNNDVGAVILITGGQDTVREEPARLDGVPVLFLPEREPDGSFLASGHALGVLLEACYGAERLAAPEHGAFGDLALMAQLHRHVPPPLIGWNMARTGWSDLVSVPPAHAGPLQIPPLLAGRTSYVLKSEPLADRGNLHLEVRAGRNPQDGLALLCYWEFSGPRPHLRDLSGHTTSPHLLRLSPQEPVLTTAFTPGGDRDLFRRTSAGVRTVTPQGEILWELGDLGARQNGSMDVSTQFLAHDLLHGLHYRGGKNAEQTEGGLTFELEAVAGDGIDAHVPAPGGLMRVFGQIHAVGGEPRLSCGCDAKELLRADLVAADGGIRFQFDLPGGVHNRRFWMRIANRRGAAARLVIRHLLAVPRSAGAQPVLPVGLPTASSTRLMDGTLYGNSIVLDPGDGSEQSFRTPLVIPGGGLLRLVCGLPAAAAANTGTRLSLELTDSTGRNHHVLLPERQFTRSRSDQPLFVALLGLPTTKEPQVGLLQMRWQGTAPLHLVTLAVDRP